MGDIKRPGEGEALGHRSRICRNPDEVKANAESTWISANSATIQCVRSANPSRTNAPLVDDTGTPAGRWAGRARQRAPRLLDSSDHHLFPSCLVEFPSQPPEPNRAEHHEQHQRPRTELIPAATSHSRIVLSLLAEARVLPFGLHATELTTPECPLRVTILFRSATFQSMTVLS